MGNPFAKIHKNKINLRNYKIEMENEWKVNENEEIGWLQVELKNSYFRDFNREIPY